MTPNFMWWWGCSSLYLGTLEYTTPFFAITPVVIVFVRVTFTDQIDLFKIIRLDWVEEKSKSNNKQT